MHTPQRPKLSLAGEWEYTPVARTTITPSGIRTDTADLPGGGRAPVPSNWIDHGPGDFDGRVEYRTTFDAPSGDGRAFLCFEGVDYFARVELNGNELGRHEGCFDPFSFEVTGLLRESGNELVVEVDAPAEQQPEIFPHRKRQLKGILNQWDPLDRRLSSTGGIWGDVWLELRPDPFISHVQVTPFLVPETEAVPSAGADRGLVDRPLGHNKAWVRFRIEVSSTRRGRERIEATVAGHTTGLDVDLPAGTSVHDVIVEVPDPVLWWTWDHGDPHLEGWRVTVATDTAEGRTGIREVRLDEATGIWWLNGRRIFGRGTNVIPDVWLSRYDDERARGDVELLRGANVNLVRVCVHLARDHFYDRLDEAGILVWQDTGLQWSYLPTAGVAAEAGRQASAMVRRLGNHPCIGLWSCQNEPFRANTQTIARVVEAAVRQAEPTRTVHLHSAFGEHAYPGWFFGHRSEYAALPAAPMPTEFGAQSLPSTDEVRELVGDVWPPDQDRWYHAAFEQVFWYRVAGVKPTGSLEEFVEATQRYQAEIVRLSIETYRTARYSRIGSLIHFLFMDGRPQISWSVVSYGRVPKRGYEALARAMQPVLICAGVVRTEIGPDWDSWRAPPMAGVRIINDTPHELRGASYEVSVGGHVIDRGTVDVPADGIVMIGTVNQDDWLAWDPPPLEVGDHEVALTVVHDGREVSRNSYPVKVIPE